MARVALVRGDSAVSAVGSAVGLGGLVDLDVGDLESVGVELLDDGVGFGVLEQVDEVLGRLDRPRTLSHVLCDIVEVSSGKSCREDTRIRGGNQ